MLGFCVYHKGMIMHKLPHYGAPCGWQMPNWCPHCSKPGPEPGPAPMPFPGPYVPARFERGADPQCPPVAVIPVLEVLTRENLKDLSACLVHVDENNTTYYIDHQHRIIQVWAGPVEVDDYDYQNNPLGLRSQEVWDFKNGRVVRYSATGEMIVTETN